MIAILFIALTWAVLPGCMMLGGHGMHGNTQPSQNRAPPATVDKPPTMDRQTMRGAHTAADKPSPPSPGVHTRAMEHESHAGFSTGAMGLGVVLMVLMMAVMML